MGNLFKFRYFKLKGFRNMFGVSRINLQKLDKEYMSRIKENKIEEYQLNKLNQIWKNSVETIPHYMNLVNNHNIPKTFDTLSQYINCVPFLTKTIIKNNIEKICYPYPSSDFFRITGGSTSEPMQIPAWKSEIKYTRLTTHLGKLWYGVYPGDKLFLFWGHSHLLGKGFSGKINAIIRLCKDVIQNYTRYSCYDLSKNNLLEAGRKILTTRPDYIIGYSQSLDRLARTNIHLKNKLSSLNLKVIIAAAETFPFKDSEKIVSEVFGTNVAMEYGSVETNLVAHTHPSGGYITFWKDYLLETVDNNGANEVVLTSLYPRKTPLFRYKIGDCINFDAASTISESGSVIKFSSVIGRTNNPVILPSGRSLHSEVVSHICRDMKDIVSYQFVCKEKDILLNLIIKETNNSSLNLNKIELNIKNKALKIDKEFHDLLKISVVNNLFQSASGKNPMVIYR